MSNRNGWETSIEREPVMEYAIEAAEALRDAIGLWERHSGDPDAAYDILASYGKVLRFRVDQLDMRLQETVERANALVKERGRELAELAFELVSPDGWLADAEEKAALFLSGDVEDYNRMHVELASVFDDLDDMQLMVEIAAGIGKVDDDITGRIGNAMRWFMDNLDVFTLISGRVRAIRSQFDRVSGDGMQRSVGIYDWVIEESVRMDRVCEYCSDSGVLAMIGHTETFPGWDLVIEWLRGVPRAVWERMCDIGELRYLPESRVVMLTGTGQRAPEPIVYEFRGHDSAWRMRIHVPNPAEAGDESAVMIQVLDLEGAQRASVCGVDCELRPVVADGSGRVIGMYEGEMPYGDFRRNLPTLSIPVCMIWVKGGKAVFGLIG